jgi:hypothetical protein
MRYPKPQTEEGIEQVKWVKRSDIFVYLADSYSACSLFSRVGLNFPFASEQLKESRSKPSSAKALVKESFSGQAQSKKRWIYTYIVILEYFRLFPSVGMSNRTYCFPKSFLNLNIIVG